jgi:hypothetical protein
MYRLSGFGDLPAAPANVQAIATAIATAEGGLTPGTFPYRTNNPCDIFVGGSTAGYSSMDAGWNACYNQINLILSGQSSIYTPDESIEDIAQSYAPASAGNNPSAWAANVASVLGISPNQPLTAVSGGSGAQPSSDSTTGFLDSLTAMFSGSDSGDNGAAAGSTLDLNNLSLTDDSGNLTGFGWLAIAGVVGLGVWVIAS